MTGVFLQRSLVNSWSRGCQYVVIMHGVQYVVTLTRGAIWRVWYVHKHKPIISFETQRMLF